MVADACRASNRPALSRCAPADDARRRIGQVQRALMCEYDFSREPAPEPLLELHQEENRCGRIHPETSELGVRADAIDWRLEGPGQIGHAPIENLGFAGI